MSNKGDIGTLSANDRSRPAPVRGARSKKRPGRHAAVGVARQSRHVVDLPPLAAHQDVCARSAAPAPSALLRGSDGTRLGRETTSHVLGALSQVHPCPRRASIAATCRLPPSHVRQAAGRRMRCCDSLFLSTRSRYPPKRRLDPLFLGSITTAALVADATTLKLRTEAANAGDLREGRTSQRACVLVRGHQLRPALHAGHQHPRLNQRLARRRTCR